MVRSDRRSKIGRLPVADHRGLTKTFTTEKIRGSDIPVNSARANLVDDMVNHTGSPKNDAGVSSVTPNDTWYAGMLSSFFGGNAFDDRNDAKSSGLKINDPPGNTGTLISSPSSKKLPNTNNVELDARIRIPDDIDEEREDVDNDSTSSGTVSTLGRGLGDDLKSLPSVAGGIVPGEDCKSLEDFENDFSLPMSPKTDSRKSPRSNKARDSPKNESVEALVEKKIKNLKSERSSRESKSVPYLRRKVFPMTAGRDDGEYDDQDRDPDSILETRRQLLVHELRHAVTNFGRFDVRCANITAALGDLYDENREYKQALRLHKDAVSVYSIKLGDHHHTTLESKLRLAQVQENSGDFDSAISTFFYVMNMTKALKSEKEPAAAEITTRIAGSLRKKGKYELAIKTLKRALKVYREVLGDTHPNVSTTVDSIASLYITVGDFAKASAILEEVVKLKAATMGMTSKEVAASLSELATSYECAEQYSKAMKNLKKAYKIYADIVGESGEKSILTLERIALIYQATGQFKKAAIAYLGVLRGRKRALGESHPTVADTYFHLGVSLRESNQQDKAFKCMKQALNIYVGEGKDMHDVEMIAEVMHELAIIHKANHNIGDAIKTFKQEIAVRRKLGQPEHPYIAQTLNHLGVAEFEIKNHNRALNYFMEALTIYEKRGTTLGTDFAEVLYNTGLVFESLRNKQRARDAFMEAARIFKENGYAETHPHYAKAMGKLKRIGHSSQIELKV